MMSFVGEFYGVPYYLRITKINLVNYVVQDDELTILDVRKFKPIHKRKFNYEVVSPPTKLKPIYKPM